MNQTFEATVVTGLEFIAADECREKLSPKTITQSHGRVFFESDRPLKEIFALRSVDNIYVIIYDEICEELPQTDEELKEKLSKISSVCQWDKGLKVWTEAFNWNKSSIETILSKGSGDETSKPSFRVTCNRTGDHRFKSQECAAILGAVINESFDWSVSMKQFDIEVVLSIKEKHIYIGLTLTRESLHKRNLVCFGATSLRATIAYNILRMASIQNGDIVCDPMCGSGAIPIECALSWPQTFGIACDNHPVAIERSNINIKESKCLIDVNHLDVTSLPFRTGSIDAIITDLPFGKRLGSRHDNKTLYPAIMTQFARCVRPGTGRIVLLTQDKRNMNKCLGLPVVKKYCKQFRTIFVKIGGLDASIYCLRRNGKEFE